MSLHRVVPDRVIGEHAPECLAETHEQQCFTLSISSLSVAGVVWLKMLNFVVTISASRGKWSHVKGIVYPK